MYYPAIDYAITLFLKRNAMKQSALAEMMGMASNTFSWKRRGIRDWTLPETVRLSEIVGMSLDVMISNRWESGNATTLEKAVKEMENVG